MENNNILIEIFQNLLKEHLILVIGPYGSNFMEK